jgi:hypothetical protein
MEVSTMMQNVKLGIITAIVLWGSASQGLAVPAALILPYHNQSNLQQVSFWGRPFPYGYNWSLVRACTRYEPVETAHGTRTQRVWVCRERRQYR